MLSFFPRDVLIESVSEGFPTLSRFLRVFLPTFLGVYTYTEDDLMESG